MKSVCRIVFSLFCSLPVTLDALATTNVNSSFDYERWIAVDLINDVLWPGNRKLWIKLIIFWRYLNILWEYWFLFQKMCGGHCYQIIYSEWKQLSYCIDLTATKQNQFIVIFRLENKKNNNIANQKFQYLCSKTISSRIQKPLLLLLIHWFLIGNILVPSTIKKANEYHFNNS